jgi:hypothetical protein
MQTYVRNVFMYKFLLGRVSHHGMMSVDLPKMWQIGEIIWEND